MTPRTFWMIFLRILGLWLVLESIIMIPQFISSAVSFWYDMGPGLLMSAIGLAGLAIVLFLILRVCVFRPDWLIDKLRLDRGFAEEKFEVLIHRSSILSIAIIVIGGMVFIDSIPHLIRELINYFTPKPFAVKSNAEWIVYYFLKVLLGYFLMTNHRLIVSFIEKKRRNQVGSE